MNNTKNQQLVDFVELGFMDARCKLIDVAAFLDRTQRAGQADDYRVRELKKAITCLDADNPERAKQVLLSLSDPTEEPIAIAPGKGAAGACPIGDARAVATQLAVACAADNDPRRRAGARKGRGWRSEMMAVAMAVVMAAAVPR